MPDTRPSAMPAATGTAQSSAEAHPFRVLYVCTGNICRSAVAERLLRLRLLQELGEAADLFEITSAGVQGLTGEPMDEDAATELRLLGGSDAGFVARRLDADQISAADLILTANRKHRSSVVRVDASAARRTFTIREFARLAEVFDPKHLPNVDSSTRLQAVVEEVAASRGTVRPDERSDFDVEDPYGGSQSLHRRIAAQIDGATTATANLLLAAVRTQGGSGPGSGPGTVAFEKPNESSAAVAAPGSGHLAPLAFGSITPVDLAAASIAAGENPGANSPRRSARTVASPPAASASEPPDAAGPGEAPGESGDDSPAASESDEAQADGEWWRGAEPQVLHDRFQGAGDGGDGGGGDPPAEADGGGSPVVHDRLGSDGGKKSRGKWWGLGVGALVVAAAGAAIWLTLSGLSAKKELEASKPLVSQARQQVLAGETAKARATVKELQGHTSKARARTHDLIWRLAAKTPFVRDDVMAITTATQGIDQIAQRVLPPLLKTSDSLRPEKLRTKGNQINLAPLEAAAPALRRAATETATIRTRVDGINTEGLAGPVARAVVDVRMKIDELAATTDDAARAAELIPPMLGADGPRRYFLAFQNPAEARGTGGLMGAYGVLVADAGHIKVKHLGSQTELENPKRLPIDPGPDWQALYGGTLPWWVNGNVSPHFPDAGRIWTAMWQQEFGEDLDGVIATDPVALGYMLKATGPARLPGGGQVTAENAVSLTMRDVYARYPTGAENPVRDAYLRGIAGAVFARLLSGVGDPKVLADQLGQAAGERRLLIYSTHADEQKKLEQTELAGAVPRTTRPFAGLVVNNYSASKLDYYLDRTLTYRRSCPSRDGTTTSSITVTLTNTAPKGLPAYVDQHFDTDSFPGKPPRSANTDYVEILATQGAALTSATLDGQELLVSGAKAQGHAAFTFNVTMLSGQTRTVVLNLTEPPTEGKVALMTPQPLVRAMSQTITIRACAKG